MSRDDGRSFRKVLICSFCRSDYPLWYVRWESLTGNTYTEAFLCDRCMAALESWGVKACHKRPIRR